MIFGMKNDKDDLETNKLKKRINELVNEKN